MTHSICNKQFTLISGPWYSIESGISDQVLRTYYLTCPGRVFVPPLIPDALMFDGDVINNLKQHSTSDATVTYAYYFTEVFDPALVLVPIPDYLRSSANHSFSNLSFSNLLLSGLL